MTHPYIVTWLAEGCVVQALPTPRGRRNALLLNRGLVTAVLKLSEEDYQKLVATGPMSTDKGGSGHGGSPDGAGDNGRGAGQRTARRSRVGVVPGHDPAADKSAGA